MFHIQDWLNTENLFSLDRLFCFPEYKEENMKSHEDIIFRLICEISFSLRTESIPRWEKGKIINSK